MTLFTSHLTSSWRSFWWLIQGRSSTLLVKLQHMTVLVASLVLFYFPFHKETVYVLLDDPDLVFNWFQLLRHVAVIITIIYHACLSLFSMLSLNILAEYHLSSCFCCYYCIITCYHQYIKCIEIISIETVSLMAYIQRYSIKQCRQPV